MAKYLDNQNDDEEDQVFTGMPTASTNRNLGNPIRVVETYGDLGKYLYTPEYQNWGYLEGGDSLGMISSKGDPTYNYNTMYGDIASGAFKLNPNDFNKLFSNQNRLMSEGEFQMLSPDVQSWARENPQPFMQAVLANRNPANQDLLSVGAEGGFADLAKAYQLKNGGLNIDRSQYMNVNDDGGWTDFIGPALGLGALFFGIPGLSEGLGSLFSGAGAAAGAGALEAAIPAGVAYAAPTAAELGAWAGLSGDALASYVAGGAGLSESLGGLSSIMDIGLDLGNSIFSGNFDIPNLIGSTVDDNLSSIIASDAFAPQTIASELGQAGYGVDISPASFLEDTLTQGIQGLEGATAQGLDYASAIPEGYPFVPVTQQEAINWAGKGGGMFDDIFGKMKNKFMESPITNSLRIGSSLNSLFSGNRQAKQLENLANQMRGSNEPFRGMAADSFANPQGWLQGPEGQAMADLVMRQLSKQGKRSSPMDFGADMMKQLGNYRNQLQPYVTGLRPDQGALAQLMMQSGNIGRNSQSQVINALSQLFKGM